MIMTYKTEIPSTLGGAVRLNNAKNARNPLNVLASTLSSGRSENCWPKNPPQKHNMCEGGFLLALLFSWTEWTEWTEIRRYRNLLHFPRPPYFELAGRFGRTVKQPSNSPINPQNPTPRRFILSGGFCVSFPNDLTVAHVSGNQPQNRLAQPRHTLRTPKTGSEYRNRLRWPVAASTRLLGGGGLRRHWQPGALAGQRFQARFYRRLPNVGSCGVRHPAPTLNRPGSSPKRRGWRGNRRGSCRLHKFAGFGAFIKHCPKRFALAAGWLGFGQIHHSIPTIILQMSGGVWKGFDLNNAVFAAFKIYLFHRLCPQLIGFELHPAYAKGRHTAANLRGWAINAFAGFTIRDFLHHDRVAFAFGNKALKLSQRITGIFAGLFGNVIHFASPSLPALDCVSVNYLYAHWTHAVNSYFAFPENYFSTSTLPGAAP